MGDHDKTKKEIHEQIIQGDKIFIHEAFNVRNIKNDIGNQIQWQWQWQLTTILSISAIIKLKTPFVLHERRQTIRLMPDKDFLQRLYSKNKAPSLTVLGWGRLSFTGPPPKILNFVELPYVEPATCKVKRNMTKRKMTNSIKRMQRNMIKEKLKQTNSDEE